jgi:hypothetical protein
VYSSGVVVTPGFGGGDIAYFVEVVQSPYFVGKVEFNTFE